MWTFEWRRWTLRWMGVLALSNLAVGCPCARGPVNASPALRWWLFSTFGAERICPEILKRGAPLKLDPMGSTIGRFFPDQCQHVVNDQAQTVTLSFGGTGYAWTPLAGRVGFRATAAVEYRMDFYMAEGRHLRVGKTARIVGGPEFQVASVENKWSIGLRARPSATWRRPSAAKSSRVSSPTASPWCARTTGTSLRSAI